MSTSFPVMLLCSALMALVTFGAATAGDGRRIWQVYENRDSVAIIYGAPRSDDVVLFILCERATGLVMVNPYLGTRAVRRDALTTITLSSSAAEVRIPGRAVFRGLPGTFLIEGETQITPNLISVFEGAGVLVIEIPGVRETIPLDHNSAFAAERLRLLCPARRG